MCGSISFQLFWQLNSTRFLGFRSSQQGHLKKEAGEQKQTLNFSVTQFFSAFSQKLQNFELHVAHSFVIKVIS